MRLQLKFHAHSISTHTHTTPTCRSCYMSGRGAAPDAPAAQRHYAHSLTPLHTPQPAAAGGQTAGGDAARASAKLRIMLRRLRFGMTVLFSRVAPVLGEVSLVRSHSEMAVRS